MTLQILYTGLLCSNNNNLEQDCHNWKKNQYLYKMLENIFKTMYFKTRGTESPFLPRRDGEIRSPLRMKYKTQPFL